MRVTLDGRHITDAPDVAAAIEAARGHAGAGRLIVAARLDGRELSSDELTGGRGLGGGEVCITTACTGELTIDALDAAGRGLLTLRSHQVAAARRIDEGDLAGCMEPLSGVLRHWQQARDAADVTLRILDAGGSCPTLADRARELSQELGGCLAELKRALAGEDWPALSDVLAYDLDALAGEWGTFLGQLKARAGSA